MYKKHKNNVTPLHFHDTIKIGTICFMFKRKSSSDSQRIEVFDKILLEYKLTILVLSYSTLKYKGTYFSFEMEAGIFGLKV